MKQKVLLSIFATLCLSQNGYTNEYADKIFKNKDEVVLGSLNINFNIGYSSYLIDVTSTELNRVIDYNVLEATMGLSYIFNNKIGIGIDTKILLDESKSNLTIDSDAKPLNDTASLDRKEFTLYGNYFFSENSIINIFYKYSNLKANDSYDAFRHYDTTFNYTSNGLALSYVFVPINFDKHRLWLSTGVVYSSADVEIFEKIDYVEDDVFIDDTQNGFGLKLGLGYIYRVSDNLDFKITGDWYSSDFGKLDVKSKVLEDVLESASLDEKTYSIRVGVGYKF